MKKLTKTQVKALAKLNGKVSIEMYPSKTFRSGYKTWVDGFKTDVFVTPSRNEFYTVDSLGNDSSFDNEINHFANYSCNNELGNTVHYYLKDDLS